jgi:hypothetical protein
VKNMANDGTYYWVLATVMAVGDGYLSVRLKPTSPLLATVAALYDELRGIEMTIENRGGSVKQAMAASGERLMERLAELGFPDYQSFMYVALPTELRGYLEARGAAQAVPASARGTLAASLAACLRLRTLLSASSHASIATTSWRRRSTGSRRRCWRWLTTSACSR